MVWNYSKEDNQEEDHDKNYITDDTNMNYYHDPKIPTAFDPSVILTSTPSIASSNHNNQNDHNDNDRSHPLPLLNVALPDGRIIDSKNTLHSFDHHVMVVTPINVEMMSTNSSANYCDAAITGRQSSPEDGLVEDPDRVHQPLPTSTDGGTDSVHEHLSCISSTDTYGSTFYRDGHVPDGYHRLDDYHDPTRSVQPVAVDTIFIDSSHDSAHDHSSCISSNDTYGSTFYRDGLIPDGYYTNLPAEHHDPTRSVQPVAVDTIFIDGNDSEDEHSSCISSTDTYGSTFFRDGHVPEGYCTNLPLEKDLDPTRPVQPVAVNTIFTDVSSKPEPSPHWHPPMQRRKDQPSSVRNKPMWIAIVVSTMILFGIVTGIGVYCSFRHCSCTSSIRNVVVLIASPPLYNLSTVTPVTIRPTRSPTIAPTVHPI